MDTIKLLTCPFCGDDGDKGRQTVTQMTGDRATFDRIVCHCCGAMAPELNWQKRIPKPTVQTEPIAWMHPFTWPLYQSEKVVKITRKEQAEHGFTMAVYATPQSLTKLLTWEEIEVIEVRERPRNGPKSMLNFARAIEAATLEKNK